MVRHIAPLILVCLALCGQAHGKKEDPSVARARVHLQAAILHFNDGEFDAAEAQMQAAYRLRPTPEMRFNLGLIYERMGQADKASDAFTSYLKERPDAPDRQAVEARLAQLRARTKEADEPAPAPQQPDARPAPAAPPAAPAQPLKETVFKTIVVYRETPPKAGRTTRLIAGGLLGLTAAGLAAGVGFTVAASGLRQALEAEAERIKATTVNEPNPINADRCAEGMTMNKGELAFCPSYNIAETGAHRAFISAGVGYGIAALSGVGSLTLFLVARRQDQRQARELAAREREERAGQVSLAPVILQGGGGLVLGGSF